MPIAPLTLEMPTGPARLVPLTPAHVDGLIAIAQDPAIWTWWSIAPMTTRERMHEWVGKALAAQQAGTELPFAVIDRASGRVAGSTRYMDIREADRGLEIGWTWYGTPWQRTGMNTQCKYLLLRHAFESLGMERVCLKTDARNDRSRAAIGRLGARYEGTLRKVKIIHDGYVRDTAFYSIIAEEWPWVRERLEGMMGRAVPSPTRR